jgi:hypothetical protein
LYSAGVVAVAAAAPHSLQNLAFSLSSVPHDPHNSPDAVISRGQPTVAPRHYRVTACQPTSAISLLRSGQRVARKAAPRGVGVWVGFRRCVRWEGVCCEILQGCPLHLRPLLLRGW